MKIALAQVHTTVGDFKGNADTIIDLTGRASKMGARLVVFSELAVCGYPPFDLLESHDFVDQCLQSLSRISEATEKFDCAVLLGTVMKSAKPGRITNSAVVLNKGKQIFRQDKTLLPTFDVFDESRYFDPAESHGIFEFDGCRLAIGICEDFWFEENKKFRLKHDIDPVVKWGTQIPDAFISISASPYEFKKDLERIRVHSSHVSKYEIPFIYVNQVGATDEIIFDGHSFVLAGDTKQPAIQFGGFEQDLKLFELSDRKIISDTVSAESSKVVSTTSLDQPNLNGKHKPDLLGKNNSDDPAYSDLGNLFSALSLGISDYCKKTHQSKIILGLSGGIDSSLVAVLAVNAVSARNVIGVALPGPYSSGHSLEDAELLAANLGISFEIDPIKFSNSVLVREISQSRNGELSPLALENLQARIRGLWLMTLCNHDNAYVLATSNKSELCMGYSTLYGDWIGALAPIGDVFKSQVYELSDWANKNWRWPEFENAPRELSKMGGPIPDRSITKAPSAELRPNQKDQDSLPTYDFLDQVLKCLVEDGVPLSTVKERFMGHSESTRIDEIWKKLHVSEYKRRQGPPILKVSPKAFGIGRRIPIAKGVI